MNPYHVYQSRNRTAPPRIEVVLEIYDGIQSLLERLHGHLLRQEKEAATPLMARAKLVLVSLAGGVDLAQGDFAKDFVRLYEFMVHCIEKGQPRDIEDALKVLTTLREGFAEVRGQALELERQGVIPPLDHQRLISVTA